MSKIDYFKTYRNDNRVTVTLLMEM